MLAHSTVETALFVSWREKIAGNLAKTLRGDISDHLQSSMSYAVGCGGKLLRPLLVCACCADLKGDSKLNEDVFHAASAIELLHAASLVHDDLPALDNDDMRRGKPSTHIAFGEGLAVLTGDALLGIAFESATVSSTDPFIAATIVLELSRAWTLLCDGQVLDIAGKSSELRTRERKTGALFSAAFRCGQLLSGNTSIPLGVAVTEFGKRLGVVFQLLDDVADSDVSAAASLDAQVRGVNEAFERCNFLLESSEAPRNFGTVKRLLNEIIPSLSLGDE